MKRSDKPSAPAQLDAFDVASKTSSKESVAITMTPDVRGSKPSFASTRLSALKTPISEKVAYVKSQGQTREHLCHWPGCHRRVPPAKWGCTTHWFRLPQYLRNKVWQAYRPGQEIDRKPSETYRAVMHEIEKWIEEHKYLWTKQPHSN